MNLFLDLGAEGEEFSVRKEPAASEQRANLNMLLIRCSQRILLSFILVPIASSAVTAHSQDHWVGTWAAEPLSAKNVGAQFGAFDFTYREIVHITLGGVASESCSATSLEKSR